MGYSKRAGGRAMREGIKFKWTNGHSYNVEIIDYH